MIHAYQLHGKNIILDINSGSVHVVDPLAYAVINSQFSILNSQLNKSILKERFSVTEEELNQLFADIEALIAAGRLFSPGEDYEALAARTRERNRGIVKALCLHVSHSCNLTCDYCFAKAGRYHGAAALMPFEVGRQALDFLIAHSGTRKNLEVDFFGGEPLMNWEVVKALVGYAREQERETGKIFRFTLTTNGMLLDDEVTAFCNREMSNVVLSLDGRREIHDALRRDTLGRGSYDVVVPKFQRFAEQRERSPHHLKSYYMRGTFTHANPDFTKDLYHMAALGFRSLSMEPVVCDPDSPHALRAGDLELVKKEYEALALEMARRRGTRESFDFYHYMLDLSHGPCLYKRVTGCGSGTEYLAVTPAGELYPCHQFVGEEAFRLGNVWKGVTRPEICDEFRRCTLFSRPECRACWARFYCSGGCAANAYHAGGSIHGLHEEGCELFRKRMECAIWLAAAHR
ncbi:MAG: thioether cross-link-forming SCIFF peptide maturase [Oscillospiraceae bacterium]|nr:thioether cross-link-forming SCIFF peptide maturase [Oscillospiraceae bacterium]